MDEFASTYFYQELEPFSFLDLLGKIPGENTVLVLVSVLDTNWVYLVQAYIPSALLNDRSTPGIPGKTHL